uniref:Protease do n=1 Tax=Magnetococcus massalia (strain MO-1) TaxID=451514 RepID=A0A1S7LP00_MAGMO|nr:Protease do [Candidatus Magnetococcus massalia]
MVLTVSVPASAGVLPVMVDGQKLPSLAPMLEKVTPAVVNIATSGRVRTQENPLLSDPFFRHFFDLPRMKRERKTRSLGSGVVVDAKRGYILTNHHVIDKADVIAVTMRDGRVLHAELVGVDPETDIAVIKVPPKGLHALPMGQSDGLRVGDFVVAIGNPFGLGQTVTSGIISALGRTGLGIKGYEDFIQTDASINPGNSGGALVNLRGELIGINTAILAKGGGNVGIGFAIPSTMAKKVMEQLIEYGEVRRGLLGVSSQDLTPELADAFGLKQSQGSVVTRVAPGSAAASAGLRAGDVITKINGMEVRDASHLRNLIGLLRVGEAVEVTRLRNGRSKTVKTVVAEPKRVRVKGKRLDKRLSGAVLQVSEDQDHPGIVVYAVMRGSTATRIGLRPGDVILEVNRNRVNSMQELAKALKSDERQMLLNIQRGKERLFYMVR